MPHLRLLPLALLLAACVPSTALQTTPTTPSTLPTLSGPTLLAAGDIARCGLPGAARTAALIGRALHDDPDATVAALGDLAYETGSAAEFRDCYAPTWGAFLNRTRPVPGNHEYATRGAAPYYAYFGARAGDPVRGYYSYDLGSWHVIALNSNCDAVGGCRAGSAQEQWLRADLRAHPGACTLAYWHHPLFSSGWHGNNPAVRDLYRALDDAHAEIVLNGHDHHYERFAPQNHDGQPRADGVRQFVVGTGGGGLYGLRAVQPNSAARYGAGYGVLKLTLGNGAYAWQYLPEDGQTWTDAGTAPCVP
ncbi:metallophosphoesterase family protein [Deinococcus maricopensis]|nr:metallophosphoesterase [Deinococcus maricopensis]